MGSIKIWGLGSTLWQCPPSLPFQYSFPSFSISLQLLHPVPIFLLLYLQNSDGEKTKAHRVIFTSAPRRASVVPPCTNTHHAAEERRRWRSWEVQKGGNKSRRERMARTAWHLNRGFPLATRHSFCLHKQRLLHAAWMSMLAHRCVSREKVPHWLNQFI